jgi:hypothetical protein
MYVPLAHRNPHVLDGVGPASSVGEAYDEAKGWSSCLKFTIKNSVKSFRCCCGASLVLKSGIEVGE